MSEMTMGSAVIPSMRYRDCHAAIAFLCDVLGFVKAAMYDGPDGTVGHAELRFGTGMVMLGSHTNATPFAEQMAPPESVGGRTTVPLYVMVPDCEPVYARVLAANTEVLQEMKDMDYGGKGFTVRDAEGYMWSVGEYDPWAAIGGGQ